ncbi:MAG: glycosyltransferase family 4 protein [Candidatus Aureabacteria bacterium]|nr:glycosyltransferase family 4 protein [Candidatus Auribacterota bacterium]
MTKTSHLHFFALRFTLGYGVDLVVAEQIEYFLNKGYRVSLTVLVQDDFYHKRFEFFIKNGSFLIRIVSKPEEALEFIKADPPDMILIHTPPFYSLLPSIPDGIIKVFYDYGEPPAILFPNKEERQKWREDKIHLAPLADLRVSISKFIQKDSAISDTWVNFLGNDHLLKQFPRPESLAQNFRKSIHLPDSFLVLNVSRYYWGDRLYKGIDEYIKVKDALYELYPETKDKIRFILAGHSGEKDRAWAVDKGLIALSNLTDEELVSAYQDCDFYLSTSQWEGYNLGLGQALSFGMNAAASDKGAHGEFGIHVSNNPDDLARCIHESFRRSLMLNPLKRINLQKIFTWDASNHRLQKKMLLIRAGQRKANQVNK